MLRLNEGNGSSNIGRAYPAAASKIANDVREPMMFKRIDHVEIVTDQLEQTERFYTEVLGFTVKARDRIKRSGLGVPIDLV